MDINIRKHGGIGMFTGKKKEIGMTLDELRGIVAPIASRYNVRPVSYTHLTLPTT